MPWFCVSLARPEQPLIMDARRMERLLARVCTCASPSAADTLMLAACAHTPTLCAPGTSGWGVSVCERAVGGRQGERHTRRRTGSSPKVDGAVRHAVADQNLAMCTLPHPSHPPTYRPAERCPHLGLYTVLLCFSTAAMRKLVIFKGTFLSNRHTGPESIHIKHLHTFLISVQFIHNIPCRFFKKKIHLKKLPTTHHIQCYQCM